MDSKSLKNFIDYLIDTKAIESTKNFAEKCDINRQYLYKMIEGEAKISAKSLAKIKSAYTDEFINYVNAAARGEIEGSGMLLNESTVYYNSCKVCATKDLLIEQQNATIAALQETLDLYRTKKNTTTNKNYK